jgi:hypothetical protein
LGQVTGLPQMILFQFVKIGWGSQYRLPHFPCGADTRVCRVETHLDVFRLRPNTRP